MISWQNSGGIGHMKLGDVEALSAAEMSRALGGLSVGMVRQRERDGEIFSIVRPGRGRDREYLAFQVWSGIRGEPLAKVLAALGKPSGAVAYAFFMCPSEALGGLAPIEALSGLSHSPDLREEVQAFLAWSADARLAAVLQAAKDHAADVLA
jgi:hypothetical protein